MSHTYKHPVTGFYITVQGDPPAPQDESKPYFGDVGQGATRGSAALTADDAKDFRTWQKNKTALNTMLNRQAGNPDQSGPNFGPAR